ncbi:phosducin-like protein [Octopus bimaculoides]|uniref:Phosducin domain-containing protein n=1 Tax=Octopus bimaculoides TaxID=37653 RepID=A0A0L8FXU2_OCTBM|nr:phosducin-like protein [Octopus bimaculoides]|eukprot:XP_014786005.1 PREDICTED: phosducin-like protein [Octopus bimaculoides]
MSLTLDDKLLGEKTHYYCSSSEEEEEEENDLGDDDAGTKKSIREPTFIPEPEIKEYEGTCTNTGVKGVINDWRQFKKLETEKRHEQERERHALAKKLTLTCRSHLDDEKEEEKDNRFMQDIEKELEELEDEFIKEYRRRRLEEMRKQLDNIPKFGKVINLASNNFVDSIDKENPNVTIIVHIFENNNEACEAMDGCLLCLSQEYPTIKFCRISARDAKLSRRFSTEGVPALLIYKGGEMIGNFIALSKEFGEDFFATDIESFLQEHGFLPNSNSVDAVIKASKTVRESESPVFDDSDNENSDFDVDY